MTLIRNFMLALLLLSCAASSSFAQDRGDARDPSPPAMTVTISTSTRGIRVAALGGARQMRLEVLGAGGDSLYSSGFQPGNVRDWDLVDAHGQHLPDGSYQCLVTFRDLSGRVGTKQGTILLQGGQPALQMSEAEQAGPAESEKRLSPVANDEAPAVTLTAHDGTDGQLVSTRGALAFRAGDFFSGRDRELMRLTPEGNLGIGTTNPQAKLDVAGTIRARDGIQFADGTLLTSAGGAAKSAAGVKATADGAGTLTPNVAGTGTVNRLPKWLDSAGTLGDSAITESNGNIGIGTAAPATRFDLVGTLTLRNTTASPGFKVGDRVSDPGRQMVYGAAAGSPYSVLNTFVQGSTLASPRLSQFSAWTSDIDQDAVNATQFAFRHDPAVGGVIATVKFGTAQAGKVSIQANYAAGVPTQLVADTNGNVGVGTASPSSKLDVDGDLKVSGNAVVNGNIAAKYQDVAEWVEASGPVAAGTVVVLDSSRPNAVKPAARAYDTRVAGVISAQPGLILGQVGEGRVMVSTTGRVKVRVDATWRPVRIGDLLVTSGREGMAMRSAPVRVGGRRMHRPGTIVGKALEPLAKGEGEILVLLSLQ